MFHKLSTILSESTKCARLARCGGSKNANQDTEHTEKVTFDPKAFFDLRQPLRMAFIAAFAFAAYAAHPANAEPSCAPADGLADRMLRMHGERIVGMGIDSRGVLIEVYAEDGGTFTIVTISSTEPAVACVISAGESWVSDEMMTGGAEAANGWSRWAIRQLSDEELLRELSK